MPPSPGPGEVLIKVGGVGVNFFEVMMRQDRYAVTPPLPFLPGVEIAGTIAALSEGVTNLSVGDRVAAALYAAGVQSGGYAEYVAVKAEVVVRLPDEISFATATALQVQGLTALHLLRSHSAAGRNVLISAAAGGVGSLLVQLAKRSGAKRVIAMASSAEKLALAQELGADAGIDYTQADWPEQVRAATDGVGPDLIFDASGGDIPARCLALLAPFGRLVLYGPLSLADFRPDAEALKTLIFGNRSVTGLFAAAASGARTPRGANSASCSGSRPRESSNCCPAPAFRWHRQARPTRRWRAGERPANWCWCPDGAQLARAVANWPALRKRQR
jgi:NADPH2:quinone reductase